MQKPKHVVIIAGEESGDIHASKLITQLKNKHPNIKISGIGGQHMSDAGAELLSDLAQYGVTGLTEVIRYLSIIRKAFKAIKTHLKLHPPDLLILVDYPGFNLRLAQYAKNKLGIKIIYYISPQIWAWKAKRIHLIKRYVDHMAVILPFEKALYTKAGIPVDFVGHPLIEKINNLAKKNPCRLQLNIPIDAKIIALLPGSRANEIERHMPVLRDTAIRVHHYDPSIHFIIPVARTVNTQHIKSYFNKAPCHVRFIEDKALECMAAADFVIVASGTASLECALLEKPMCIIYKSSLLTYIAAMKLIQIKFLGLCNVLMNKMMVPEFLQYDCNPLELSRYVIDFYNNPNQSTHMINQLAQLKDLLSSKKSERTLLDIVEANLKEINA